MTKNINYVSHKKSKVKNNGKPQLPSANVLVEGEIAINYAEDVETLSIKNESGTVVTFSSDNYYTEQKLGSGFTGANSARTVTEVIEHDEEVTAAALNNLNDIKLDVSAYTPTDLSNYYTKDETSGATELSNAFSAKADNSDLTTLSGTVTSHTANADIHVTSANKATWDAKANLSDIPSVTEYADSVKYNSTSKEVEFYHGGTEGTKVFSYDASPFIIDGMVQNVEVKDVTSGESQVTCLVISFNTDAGKQDINIPISQIFDASNYYTTAQTDTKITEATSGKIDNATYTAYTAATATEIGLKASQSDLNTLSGTVTVHTADTSIHFTTGDVKTQIDNSISGKADTTAVTQSIEAAVSGKANSSDVYTKLQTSGASEIATALEGKQPVGDYALKSEIPTVPTNVSAFNNDAGYITSSALNGYATEDYVTAATSDMATKTWVGEQNYLTSADISGKQDVSGMTAYTTTATTNTLSGTVTAHTADTTIHVTADDKSKWNNVDNKLNTSDFNTYSGAVDTAISNKVDKVSGKDLSSNDFTDTLKTKLDNIASGAEVNVQADWTETDTTSDSYIQNKPTLGTAAAKGVSNGISNTDNLIESKHIYSGVGVTVAYDSESHYIQLKNTAGSVLSSFNASAFLVDGMVESVTLETKSGSTYLVITWNTAAGKTKTELNIGDIFEADNYYTTAQTDTAIEAATSGKVDTTTFTAHTASTVHMSDTEKTNLDSLATNIATISGITSTKVSNWDTAASGNYLTATTKYAGSSTQGGAATSAEKLTNTAAIGSGTQPVFFTADGVPSATTYSLSKNVPSDAVFTDTTYTAGSFVTITGSNNSINVTTGTSSSSIARGDHNHDAVYQKMSVSGTAAQLSAGTDTTQRVWTAKNLKDGMDAVYAKTADVENMEQTLAAGLSDVNERMAEKSALNSLASTVNDIRTTGISSRRLARKDFTSYGLTWFINTLKKAVADQDLEKYGMKVGDYIKVTHDTKTYNYVIAGLNTMRGSVSSYRVTQSHVGIIVDTNDTHAWNSSNNTYTSQNSYSTGGTWTTGTAGQGYANCDLHYYLTTTVLSNVESDLGSANLLSHYKLYGNSISTTGYNRYGSNGGCTNSWAWYADQKICALSEIQVYGSIVWSSSGYDTGEACRQLDVFRVYNMNEIFEGRYPWLRDVASASDACYVTNGGFADNASADHGGSVAALILFA